VAQIFVHGDSLKTCLVGIVVPDPEVLLVEAAKIGLNELTMEQLCERGDIKKLILKDLVSVGKAAKLLGFEQVKDIYLCAEQFSVENNLLTPTLKSKRPQLRQHFADVIDKMYSKLQ
jgi:long-chain acyl-CoA synthetase